MGPGCKLPFRRERRQAGDVVTRIESEINCDWKADQTYNEYDWFIDQVTSHDGPVIRSSVSKAKFCEVQRKSSRTLQAVFSDEIDEF